MCRCECHYADAPSSFSSPVRHLSLTPTFFHQLPYRDYLDPETAKVPSNHSLAARVMWDGHSYILFFAEDDNLYRWKLDLKAKSSLWLYADRECRRLVHVLEALIVRDAEWSKLPLKVKVRGESYYSPLYSHPLNAVRYPMMGLTEDGTCGAEKRLDISLWLGQQGFDYEATQGQVEGILDNVMADAGQREKEWGLILCELAEIKQTYMVGQLP